MRRRAAAAGMVLFLLALCAATMPSAGAADKGVTIVDNAFQPGSVSINTGDRVVWTDQGTNPHSVTADDGSFDSSPACGPASGQALASCMKPGETFAHTFDKPGTFTYGCRIHRGSGMVGTVVVSGTAITTTTAAPATTTTVRATTTTPKPTTTTTSTTAKPTTTVPSSSTTFLTEIPTSSTSSTTTSTTVATTPTSGGGGSLTPWLIVFAALVLLGAGGYGLYRLWPGAGRGFGPGPDIGPGPDGL